MESLLRRSVSALLKLKYPRFTPRRCYAVDDDGDLSQFKTTVTILNQEQDQGIFIDSYSSLGFLLSSGIRVFGPCAIFPRSVLHWNVRNVQDINEDSLSLFTMLEPKIDILVLGVGERDNMKKIDSKIMRHLRANKINVEMLPTDQALATFNFLNAEKRYVAGAFIPPSYIDSIDDDDIISSQGDIGKFRTIPLDEKDDDDDFLFPGEKKEPKKLEKPEERDK